MSTHAEPEPAAAVVPSGGTPLPPGVRARFEDRLGADLGSVRVHIGPAAAAAAGAADASAFTYGEDVVFGAGRFSPGTPGGAGLLLHELTHVVQQRGGAGTAAPTRPGDTAEREADAVAGGHGRPTRGASPVRVARAPLQQAPPAAPAVAASPPTRLDDFRRRLSRLAIEARVGTREDQAALVNAQPGAGPTAFGATTAWQAWDPGPDSEVYEPLYDAIADFSGDVAITGLATIVFLRHAYGVQAGQAVPDPQVPAEVRGRTLYVYEAVTRGGALPAGRSAGGHSPIQAPTVRDSVRRNVTLGLARDLVTSTTAPRTGQPPLEASLVRDFARRVGWIAPPPSGGTWRLLDVGRPITEHNWDESQWVEQPLTGYMTANPGDDFAEAVAAYVHRPDALRARSPRRFAFLDSRRSQWAPTLRVPTPPAGQPAVGATMTRADFEQLVAATYGVTTVRDGTYEDQQRIQSGGRVIPPTQWEPWSAQPDREATYAAIVRGLQRFTTSFGAVPVFTRIEFFRANWGVTDEGLLGRVPILASMGPGLLTVYGGIVTSNRTRTNRSEPGVTPVDVRPAGPDAVEHNITHELGHELERVARFGLPPGTPPGAVPASPAQLPLDPGLQGDYDSIMGWLPYHATYGDPVLLDTGAPIEASNWTDPKWVDQVPAAGCLSGPEADLAQSLALAATDVVLLQSRSQARWEFVVTRLPLWTRAARPGDYPLPSADPDTAMA